MHAIAHSEKLYWYMARAGGLTSWWLVALTVFWGLMLSTRVARGRATPAWLLDLHRFMGGLAVMAALIKGGVLKNCVQMGKYFVKGLEALKKRFSFMREIRGKGLLIGVELARPAAPLVAACRDQGLLVLSAGEQVLRLAPPLIVDEAACDSALATLDRVLGATA